MFLGRFPSIWATWAARCNRCRRFAYRVRQLQRRRRSGWSRPTSWPDGSRPGPRPENRWGASVCRRPLDDHQQKPLAVSTHHQMTLARFVGIEALLVVGANQERDQDTALQRQQAHLVHAIKPHNPLVVGHGRIRAKRGAARLVASIRPGDPCQTAHSHLRRQVKLRPQCVVVEALQRQLVVRWWANAWAASQLHASLKRASVARNAMACASVGSNFSCKVSSIRKTLARLCLIRNDCMPSASAAGIAPKTGQPFFPHQPTDAVWLEHPERISGDVCWLVGVDGQDKSIGMGCPPEDGDWRSTRPIMAPLPGVCVGDGLMSVTAAYAYGRDMVARRAEAPCLRAAAG